MLGIPMGKRQEDLKLIGSSTVYNRSPIRRSPCSSLAHQPGAHRAGRAVGTPAPESTEKRSGQSPARPDKLAVVRQLRAAVSHVEVDNILCVSPLHGNGKRLKRVKSEGNEASHCVVDGAAQ